MTSAAHLQAGLMCPGRQTFNLPKTENSVYRHIHRCITPERDAPRAWRTARHCRRLNPSIFSVILGKMMGFTKARYD